LSAALAGKVTPVILTAVVPVLMMLTVCYVVPVAPVNAQGFG
jgi:hypothetical protein